MVSGAPCARATPAHSARGGVGPPRRSQRTGIRMASPAAGRSQPRGMRRRTVPRHLPGRPACTRKGMTPASPEREMGRPSSTPAHPSGMWRRQSRISARSAAAPARIPDTPDIRRADSQTGRRDSGMSSAAGRRARSAGRGKAPPRLRAMPPAWATASPTTGGVRGGMGGGQPPDSGQRLRDPPESWGRGCGPVAQLGRGRRRGPRATGNCGLSLLPTGNPGPVPS